MARIIVTASAIRSTHTSDIARASGIPELYVLAMVSYLRSSGWEYRVLTQFQADDRLEEITINLDNFLHFMGKLNLDVRDAMRLFGGHI